MVHYQESNDNIYNINRSREKNHMIISMNTEETSDKI